MCYVMAFQRLELTSRVTLAVLAFGSEVYTYLGVLELLNDNSTLVSVAAEIYSIAAAGAAGRTWSAASCATLLDCDRVLEPAQPGFDDCT